MQTNEQIRNIVQESITSVSNACVGKASNSFVVNVNAGDNLDFSSDVTQNAVIDMKCFTDSTVLAAFKATLKIKLEQIAKQIKQSLSLNIGSQTALNLSRIITNLHYAITQSISNKCTSTSGNTQQYNFNVGAEGDINLKADQTAKTLANCALRSQATATAMLELDTAIRQVSTQTEKGSSLVWVVIALIGGGVAVVAFGGHELLKPDTILTLGGVVLVGAVVFAVIGAVSARSHRQEYAALVAQKQQEMLDTDPKKKSAVSAGKTST